MKSSQIHSNVVATSVNAVFLGAKEKSHKHEIIIFGYQPPKHCTCEAQELQKIWYIQPFKIDLDILVKFTMSLGLWESRI